MLTALIMFMIVLLSGSVSWHSAPSGVHAATVPTITPQDPSSLALALIGGGMVAVYLAVSRTRRARPPLARLRRSRAESTVTAQRDESDARKSRGAA